MSRQKKTAKLTCNGHREVTIKTVNGAFRFNLQRFAATDGLTSDYLEATGQVTAGYVSLRLAEFSAYYSNRMSYEEVAGLLERCTGSRLLSDQSIQSLVIGKAMAISQQWQSEVAATAAAPLPPLVMPQLDWYDPDAKESTTAKLTMSH